LVEDTTRAMSPDPGWYPVALAEGIAPGTSAGTRLFGQELVVWRDNAGASHVWEDRCPHRGMRLSFGFVRGNAIACLYHGWQYDTAGRCRSIPAHPDLKVPSTIAATTYPSAEQLGMVWVSLGGADPPGDNAVTTPVRSLSIQAPPALVLAALASSDTAPFTTEAAVVCERSGPLISVRAGEERLIAAVQTLSDTQATVHLALAGAPELYRGAGQARASLWAEALRRRVEAAAAIEAAEAAWAHEAVS
jgi:nitrite reductase/ring-hydroxylating ferredoxin subunit